MGKVRNWKGPPHSLSTVLGNLAIPRRQWKKKKGGGSRQNEAVKLSNYLHLQMTSSYPWKSPKIPPKTLRRDAHFQQSGRKENQHEEKFPYNCKTYLKFLNILWNKEGKDLYKQNFKTLRMFGWTWQQAHYPSTRASMRLTGLRTLPASWATGDMFHKQPMSPKPKPN